MNYAEYLKEIENENVRHTGELNRLQQGYIDSNARCKKGDTIIGGGKKIEVSRITLLEQSNLPPIITYTGKNVETKKLTFIRDIELRAVNGIAVK